MARITAWYFRLATILVSLALGLVHVASGTTTSVSYSTCRFSPATRDKYGANLVARGTGSVTLQNVTCMCHIGKPDDISVFFLEGEATTSNHSLTSPICEGVSSCEKMPDDCENTNLNIVSKVNIKGTFTKSAVIVCKSTMNPNKDSLIVWVEPVPESAPSQSTSVVPSSSEIVVTTTSTTEKESLSASITLTVESSPTTAVSSVCTTLTNTLTETVSATTTLIVSASDCMPPSLTVTASATTMLTVSTSDYMSPTLTLEPTVVVKPNIWIVPTTTVISILIIIIVILLVVVTVAIMIARSNHRSGTEQISATNPIVIEHKEIHTEV